MKHSVVPSLSNTRVVHAAGGLLWRPAPAAPHLALIRRLRHGDEWSLPKGKLNPGESWEMGAVREVSEETGCDVRLGSFAGGQIYMANNRPKVVLYWHMICLSSDRGVDAAEILELAWLDPAAALQRLTHASERELLTDALPSAPTFP